MKFCACEASDPSLVSGSLRPIHRSALELAAMEAKASKIQLFSEVLRTVARWPVSAIAVLSELVHVS
jgi:hypothetical protein